MGHPPHPTHPPCPPPPQLLTMKECSREKVLEGKKSQYDPPYPSRSVGPGGQQGQEHGVFIHVKGEGYQPPITSRAGSRQVPQCLTMTPLPT